MGTVGAICWEENEREQKDRASTRELYEKQQRRLSIEVNGSSKLRARLGCHEEHRSRYEKCSWSTARDSDTDGRNAIAMARDFAAGTGKERAQMGKAGKSTMYQ